jgi:hypothetical protein
VDYNLSLQAVALYEEVLKLSIKPTRTAAANVFAACYAAGQYAAAVQYIDATLPDLRYDYSPKYLHTTAYYACLVVVCYNAYSVTLAVLLAACISIRCSVSVTGTHCY